MVLLLQYQSFAKAITVSEFSHNFPIPEPRFRYGAMTIKHSVHCTPNKEEYSLHDCALFLYFSSNEMGLATYTCCQTHMKMTTSNTSGGLCASEVDRTLIHYDVTFTKEVAAMVHIISMFRYHTIRLQTTQTTSGPRGSITK